MHQEEIRQLVDSIYHSESRRVLATLIRLLKDFDLAEDALHDAFAAALKQWPEQGVPANPQAWLVSTGRFKAIDSLRRRARFDATLPDLSAELEAPDPVAEELSPFPDDQLRLIFTCCHPILSEDSRIALTLREVCGLTTEEIARAFLLTPSTLAQRIVRAKAKIRDAKIPYQIPSSVELPERLDAVLHVIYLVFNEGYFASSGASLIRADLSAEAIRLARLLLQLLPDSEVIGLLGLMLLHESRRDARTSFDGDIVLLADQDRSLWKRDLIDEGSALVNRALATQRFGFYTVQAAIALVHAQAASADQTNWQRIVTLYDLLIRIHPSPVINLNRAVAVAMAEGPLKGLSIIDDLMNDGELSQYHLAHSARADLCRRLGRFSEARASYEKALSLSTQEPERRFYQKRLSELSF